MKKQEDFNEFELEKFRATQRIANECAVAVSKQLYDGITEKQAAKMMRNYLAERNVTKYFHLPFAWFGDRTAFHEFRSNRAFAPTDRILRTGMPVILDVAPCIDGYTADIGYTFSFGENQQVDEMRHALVPIRKSILQNVLAGKTFLQIYREVDDIFADLGFKNVHKMYPERVLAHRVFKTQENFISKFHLGGFGVQHLSTLITSLRKGLNSSTEDFTPAWNDKKESDHPPIPGLWAVEPHMALPNGAIGAKWEELLVITKETAYWLDDNVPHLTEIQPEGISSNVTTIA